MAAQPPMAPVRAAITRTFTSGTTTSFTFSLAGLTKNTTYLVGVFDASGTPQLSGLTVSGTGFTATGGTDLTLVVGAVTSVDGLTITTGTLNSNGNYVLKLRVSTATVYPANSNLTIYYDKTFSAGWSAASPITVVGSELITGGLNVGGPLLVNGARFVGVAGASGATGPVGASGATGPVGASGATGRVGASGASGPVGLAGASGPSGPMGLVGASGASGPMGLVGASGAAGSTTGSGGATTVAVGSSAGLTAQGSNAIAIGYCAGLTSQAIGSIIINATGNSLDNTVANTCVIKSLRGDTTARLTAGGFTAMYYNRTTGELCYSTG